MTAALVIGIDLGTSGARAVAMSSDFEIAARAAASFADPATGLRRPEVWWEAVTTVLENVVRQIPASGVRAIAVDATSGTLLPIDRAGTPLAPPLMYSDRVRDGAILQRILPHIPAESGAHGESSGLAKALVFQEIEGVHAVLHQADWIAGRLTGRFSATDENNALKTGYDPVERRWPNWLSRTGLNVELLPEVLEPGAWLGGLSDAAAARFGLEPGTRVLAGTTDGCASFLATGASEAGDGVSALGSTLTIKLLSDRPVFSPESGVYSHRINDLWLAGGASNSGGRVLSHYFTADEIDGLSGRIDPASETRLDYYPLLAAGERFPVMDPDLQPRLSPRPRDDAEFLKGMLEGIATIEQHGYARLAEAGAPRLRTLRTVGGGAGNAAWTAIRQKKLTVPFLPAHSQEAAAGTARLALAGLRKTGMPA